MKLAGRRSGAAGGLSGHDGGGGGGRGGQGCSVPSPASRALSAGATVEPSGASKSSDGRFWGHLCSRRKHPLSARSWPSPRGPQAPHFLLSVFRTENTFSRFRGRHRKWEGEPCSAQRPGPGVCVADPTGCCISGTAPGSNPLPVDVALPDPLQHLSLSQEARLPSPEWGGQGGVPRGSAVSGAQGGACTPCGAHGSR